MPAGVIDVRAQVFSNLGPVISGQLSDDPVAPGVGLLRTQGEVVINGLIQPARGTEIKLGVRLPDGNVTRFPRRLRVLKAESDPINNETMLTVGCLLALRWDFVQPAAFFAANDPPWSNVDTAAGSAPIVSFLQNVVVFCLANCSIVQASGNPAIPGVKAVEKIDVSNGYLNIASTIIAEAGLYGFIDANEKLRLRSVLFPRTKGPLLTVNDTITNDSIGNASPPERITIGYGQAVLPTVETPANYQPQNPTDKPYNWPPYDPYNPADPTPPYDPERDPERSWTYQKTISPAETFITDYRVKVGDSYQTKTDQVTFASTSEVVTQYVPLTYTDKDGKEQSQDVVFSTISTTTTCVAAANPTRWKSKLEAGSPAYPGTALTKQTETYNKYTITEDGPVESEVTTFEYEPRIAFAGGLAIENYKNIDLGTGNILARKTIVQKEQNKTADLTLQATTFYQAWGTTSGGKTAASVLAAALKKASDADRISGTYKLVDRMAALICVGVEKTINLGRGVAPVIPSNLKQQNDRLKRLQDDLKLNGGWEKTDSNDSQRNGEKSKSQIITLLFGSDWTLKTDRFDMQYAPDSYMAPADITVSNGTGLRHYHVPSVTAAYYYGRVVQAILSGMAHGKSITTELRNLPSEPMGTLYLEAAGTIGRFRANGTTFAFDSQGLIAGCDAMLDGGAGLLAGASGADWFPLEVPAANLPTITPATNSSPALANTITTPSGFDPAAPGSVWTSLGTAGVEGDVYAAELTVASTVKALSETVQRESVSRSLTWLLDAPYNATPVTVSLVSVATSYGTFSAFTATTAPGVAWVTTVTLFEPGTRRDGRGYNDGVAWVTTDTTFTPGGRTNGPNNGVAWVTPSTVFTPGARFNGVGLNLGVQWVTASTTFTPGSRSVGTPWVPTALDLWYENPTSGASWVDKSHSRALVQTTTSQQPTLNTSALNGLPGLVFDGVNDVMVCSDAGANGVANFSMFLVIKYLSISTAENGDDLIAGIGGGNNNGSNRYAFRSAANGGNNQGFNTLKDGLNGSGNVGSSSGINCDAGGSFHIWSFVQSGTSVIIARDGVSQSFTMSQSQLAVSTPEAMLGAYLGVAWFANISVCAWLAEYRAVSSADQQRYEGLLADTYWRKQGAAVPLLSSHPYYAGVPTT